MRRNGYIIALLICFMAFLVVPLVAHWMYGGPAGSNAASAAAEDRLVIISPHNQDIRDEFRWAFADWHQEKYGKPVQLEYLSPGGSNDVKRQLDSVYRSIRDHHGGVLPPEDQINANVDIQLVWGGGDSFFDRELKPLGILRPITLPPGVLTGAFPEPTLGGVNLYDQERNKAGEILPPRWIGVCLSSFGIVYNQDVFHSMGLTPPTTWSDLTNPELSGAVALANPSHSGSAAMAYMMILQRAMADSESAFFDLPQNRQISHDSLRSLPAYEQALDAGWKKGMAELLLIAANARYFSDSSNQVPTDVASGDAAVGMAIDFYCRVIEQSVGSNREKYVMPAAATAITPDPIAILYGTQGEKLVLARHFVEFLLSPRGQRLWVLRPGVPGGPRLHALGRQPARKDVYADRTNWVDQTDYFAQSGGFNQRGEWMTLFADLRMIWSAAWIDVRDDLRQSYQTILAVPDEAERARLLQELSDLPITRPELNAYMQDRKRVEADHSQDADEWKAAQRIRWSRRFQDHYRRVAEEARNSPH